MYIDIISRHSFYVCILGARGGLVRPRVQRDAIFIVLYVCIYIYTYIYISMNSLYDCLLGARGGLVRPRVQRDARRGGQVCKRRVARLDPQRHGLRAGGRGGTQEPRDAPDGQKEGSQGGSRRHRIRKEVGVLGEITPRRVRGRGAGRVAAGAGRVSGLTIRETLA